MVHVIKQHRAQHPALNRKAADDKTERLAEYETVIIDIERQRWWLWD